MPIYVDPTELRPNTRLPKAVRVAVIPLPGLERRTGGDILITPLEQSLTDVVRDVLPVRRALEMHFDNGALLVARKSGGDLLSSIADLKEIELRMLEWVRPGACWLAFTGIQVENGVVSAFGRKSKIAPAQVQAALTWWQLRGGHYANLANDDEIGAWLNEMLSYVKQIAAQPVRTFVHVPATQTLRKEEQNWVTTGLAFPPGIGRKKRVAIRDALIVEGFPPTLSNAIFRALWIKPGVPGFGKALIEKCNEWIEPEAWRKRHK